MTCYQHLQFRLLFERKLEKVLKELELDDNDLMNCKSIDGKRFANTSSVLRDTLSIQDIVEKGHGPSSLSHIYQPHSELLSFRFKQQCKTDTNALTFLLSTAALCGKLECELC